MTATIPILLLGLLAGTGLGALVALWYARRSADTLRGEMQAAFSALSQDALQRSNSTLLQTADQALRARQEAIDALIVPVRETLDKMQTQVARADRDREGSFQAVKAQLTSLTQAQEVLRRSADGLSSALKSPNARGRWGEIQLKRIVELAGMIEHCDFEQQVTSTGDARLRPDLVIHLPGNAAIVVDAKVPIDAYMKATEATSETDRDKYLDAHVAALRGHIKTLSAKKYWEQFGDASPEFVVLFLPIEPLMHAAFERDGMLLEDAASQSVVLATPMTLLALLRAVAGGWTQLSTAKNAEAIRDAAIELCDRLEAMLGHFDSVGGQLKKALDAFNATVGSFDARVMPSVAKLRELKLPHAGKIELPATQPDFLRHFESPDDPGTKRPN
jgi:DNA recombination protein RmuC